MWLAHGGTGSWDEIAVAAIGLALLLYFGLIWRPAQKHPNEPSDPHSDQDSENTPDRLD